ncbi:MAG: DUF4838 domain-containing protein [Pirellulales bacterium]|nr:DUF4838 domain-containing protein [Pirellulales bacterium]
MKKPADTEQQCSRRRFLKASIASTFAATGSWAYSREANKPFFETRGVVLVPKDIQTWDWVQKAKQAGLSTIATHITPSQVAKFVATDAGRSFLQSCRDSGLEVEHELHAIGDLLPRELFKKDPNMFRMNKQGQRTADYNLCVHSKTAIDILCENALQYAKILRPTTGRYFYWIDDGKPMCFCRKCRGLSDSDQALLMENHLLRALRQQDPRACLAHLVYLNTMRAPTQVKPEPGIFMEFAPIRRRMDKPLSRRDVLGKKGRLHGKILEDLDANLEVFGGEGAQALEYWLDASRFAGWRRKNLIKVPFDGRVFLDDLQTYARRGIRHVTSFAVWIDGEYVKRFGPPPLDEYGQVLLHTRPKKA